MRHQNNVIAPDIQVGTALALCSENQRQESL
jgi:hypothetical protein